MVKIISKIYEEPRVLGGLHNIQAVWWKSKLSLSKTNGFELIGIIEESSQQRGSRAARGYSSKTFVSL